VETAWKKTSSKVHYQEREEKENPRHLGTGTWTGLGEHLAKLQAK